MVQDCPGRRGSGGGSKEGPRRGPKAGLIRALVRILTIKIFVILQLSHEYGEKLKMGWPGIRLAHIPEEGGGKITCCRYGYVHRCVLGPKFSRRGSLFRRFSLNMGGYPEIGKKLSKMGSFPPKFIIKVGMTAKLPVIRRG